jgi:hypothetical protein
MTFRLRKTLKEKIIESVKWTFFMIGYIFMMILLGSLSGKFDLHFAHTVDVKIISDYHNNSAIYYGSTVRFEQGDELLSSLMKADFDGYIARDLRKPKRIIILHTLHKDLYKMGDNIRVKIKFRDKIEFDFIKHDKNDTIRPPEIIEAKLNQYNLIEAKPIDVEKPENTTGN